MRLANLCVVIGSSIMLAIPVAAHGGTVTFTNHSHGCYYLCGGAPSAYYHADLNSDGREDLLYPYYPEMGTNGSFEVQLSNGDGTYADPVNYQIPQGTDGNFIQGFATGEFNNDGNPDVVVFGQDNNVYLYLNQGNGTLSVGGKFPYTGGATSVVGVTVGDFNHDNLSDLVFVSNGQLYIWFGNGKGGFAAGPSMGVNGSDPQMGDFDGDGFADLLLRDNVNGNIAYVLYGDGTGHFPKTATITMPSGYVDFTIGDVNSDGLMDVIATEPGANVKSLSVFYGQANRTLTRKTIGTARCVSGAVTTADLDGNGMNDLIVPEADCSANLQDGTRYIDVITRSSSGANLSDQTIYTSPSITGDAYPYFQLPSPPTVLRGDLNTKPDLLVSQCGDDRCDAYTVTTMLNTTAGSFPSCAAPSASTGINVCSPSSTAPSTSVAFAVGASGPVAMRDVEVRIDGVKKAEQIDGFSNYTFLNKSLTLSAGSHKVSIYAAGWDQSVEKKTFTLMVQ